MKYHNYDEDDYEDRQEDLVRKKKLRKEVHRLQRELDVEEYSDADVMRKALKKNGWRR